MTIPGSLTASDIDVSGAVTLTDVEVATAGGALTPLSEKLQEPFVSVKDYGATGGGVDYDTDAIRAAIADAGSGRRLFFPKGKYRVKHDGLLPYLFKLDRQIQIFGEGSMIGGSEILVEGSVPSTVDVFRIEPNLNDGVNYSSFGWSTTDVRIAPLSGTPARHGVCVNLGVNQFLAKFLFSRNYVGPFNGSCFYQYKNIASDHDAMFSTTIRDNFFRGGTGGCVFLENTGDSLTIVENTMTGAGPGIYMKPAPGAAMQVIAWNNITAAGGAIQVIGGTQTKILYNQMEQAFPYTMSADAMIMLDGASNCDVIGNNLNAYNRVSCVRIRNGGRRNTIERNVLRCSATEGKHHVVIDANAGNLNHVGSNDLSVDGLVVYAPRIADASSGAQIGVWKQLSALNGWVNGTNANFHQGGQYCLRADRSVAFRGAISGGTFATNTQILSALPPEARPTRAQRGLVHILNGSAWTVGWINLDAAGQIIALSIPANNLLYFDGLTFSLTDV